jgi:hypothetical protein
MEFLKMYHESEHQGQKVDLKLLRDKNYQKSRNENPAIRELIKGMPKDTKDSKAVTLAKIEEEAMKQALGKQEAIEEMEKILKNNLLLSKVYTNIFKKRPS